MIIVREKEHTVKVEMSFTSYENAVNEFIALLRALPSTELVVDAVNEALSVVENEDTQK